MSEYNDQAAREHARQHNGNVHGNIYNSYYYSDAQRGEAQVDETQRTDSQRNDAQRNEAQRPYPKPRYIHRFDAEQNEEKRAHSKRVDALLGGYQQADGKGWLLPTQNTQDRSKLDQFELDEALIRAGNVPTMQRLLAQGANPNHNGMYTFSMLHQLSEYPAHLIFDESLHPGTIEHGRRVNAGWKNAVQVLVEAGADVNYRLSFGESPLEHASKSGRGDVALALVNAGADLYAATSRGNITVHDLATMIADRVIGSGEDTSNTKGPSGEPLLWAAIFSKKKELVQVLIEEGGERVGDCVRSDDRTIWSRLRDHVVLSSGLHEAFPYDHYHEFQADRRELVEFLKTYMPERSSLLPVIAFWLGVFVVILISIFLYRKRGTP